MKRILYVLPLLFAMLLMQSCEEDPIVQPLGPDIGFTAGGNDITLAPGEAFTVQVTASRGDGELNGFFISEDGASIDVSRITINGNQPGSSAILLTGSERDGFTFDITVLAHTDANATKAYVFEVIDVNSLSDQVFFNITTEKVSASLSFTEEAPYFWMDAMVPANTLFRVKLNGTAGSSEMNSFTVYQDDVAVPIDRLEINGSAPVENPVILADADRNSFSYDMLIRAHDSGVATYAFEIADVDGETMRVTIDISSGTLVDSIKTVLLLNAGGPVGQGGVNLITGESIGSSNADAHLIDKGIDTDLPMATNWIKKIGPGPNAELRLAGASAPEGFSYETTTTKEVIQAAYDTGDTITETEVVGVGDLLLVQKDGIYFLVKVTSINETMDDNADYYELEVKF